MVKLPLYKEKPKKVKKKRTFRSPIWHYTLDALLLYIRQQGDEFSMRNETLLGFQQFVTSHLNNKDIGGASESSVDYGNICKEFSDKLEEDFSFFEK